MNIKSYFKYIPKMVRENYKMAEEARKKGVDPVESVEIPIATSLAEKAVGLISSLYPQISDRRIVDRILGLEKEYGSLDPAVALTIAEEIAREKYCKFKSHKEAIEAGARVAISYLTLGVVSSPIEGFVSLEFYKTKDGKDYFAPFYSGPIRSAGGTEAAFSVVVLDYLRECFGYARYDPTEDEVKRAVHESYLYHERITNLQYLPTEKEIDFLARNVPVQISGDASEQMEVFNYKDLARVPTNFIRSGFALTLNEGLAQKAPKILKRIKKLKEKGFKLSGWDWFDKFVDFQNEIKESKAVGSSAGAVYIKDLVAGRPVFGHPSRSGSFRLRYGRCRNTGYSGLALHPATMGICDNFIAIGTQLKIEMPTKGCTVASCSEIGGPIVRFSDGSVREIKDYAEARKLYKDVSEIIYLGDLLVPYGDYLNRNHVLNKPGYVEQYWLEQLKNAVGEGSLSAGAAKNKSEFSFVSTSQNLNKLLKFCGFEDAVKISRMYGVPLHPNYIFYWGEIEYGAFFALLGWFSRGMLKDGKIVLPYSSSEKERFVKGKRALEILGCEHEISIENVIIGTEKSKALIFNLGFGVGGGSMEKGIDGVIEKVKNFGERNVLELINELCEFEIKDKSGTFIGARMGRPEKAKLRKLTGSPHVLFPVGDEGGRLRSFQSAIDVGSVRAEFPIFYCESCKSENVYSKCIGCGGTCKKMHYCSVCDKNYLSPCEEHERSSEYKSRRVNIRDYFEKAKRAAKVRTEDILLVKGVRGTTNKDHTCENLAKGLLRAKYNLNVNKDGTIRYDMTEQPITQFKPCEIGASVTKLKELGYERDVFGKMLENENQIIEIFPHDVIMPACPDSPDEGADEVFLRVSRFVDDELEKIYGMDKIFNAKTREDLLGVFLGCMAPHNCAAVVARLIGFSKTQGFLASPYMHAAMRRDCLGYDNYVSVKENGCWKIKKIGEFVNSYNLSDRIDNFGTLGRRMKDICVWSNPGQAEVVEMTKHKPTRMRRIFLEDGRKIELTDNHKVYVAGKKEKRAYELQEGDKLMISYKRDVKEKDIEELFLPEIFSGRDDVALEGVNSFLGEFDNLNKYDNYYQRNSYPIKFVREFLGRHGKCLEDLPSETRISIRRDNVLLPIRVVFDEKLLEVVGLYIAEGYLRKNESKNGFYQISIAGNEEIKNLVKSVFYSHFGIIPSYENLDKVTFSSRLVYELFKDYFGLETGAMNQRISSLFLDLKKGKMAALLRGYFEGTGSVSLSDARVACDTASEGLKYDLSFALSRFDIFTKFYEYQTESGKIVKEFYLKKNKPISINKMTKVIVLSDFVKKFQEIGFISERKNKILKEICKRNPCGAKIELDDDYAYPKVVKIEEIGEDVSFCFNVSSEHNFFANDILVHNCDGDEAAAMLLMDMLLNFSRSFLPAHRGGTQDAPLVLNACLRAGEVDDMIFDVDVSKNIPLDLYTSAEGEKSPYDVKMEQVKGRLGGSKEFSELWYSYDTDNINSGPLCSSYKLLPTMQEKVDAQMELCKKIRAVDTSDVARLIIERHFIRDTRGNLRKFSMQGFRCVGCNAKYRRPPLTGKCTKCGGKLIFTISEGSILKYMQPALELARSYGASQYLLESLELTEMYIESIFGRDSEKQETISKWF